MEENKQQLPATIPPGAAIQAKNEIEFKPFGSDDAIKLSLNVIKTYVAVPARMNDGQEIPPDERECMRFMMLCRTQRLNPFAGDAFMVPFFDKREGRHKWSLITGITSFYKRAELHPEYDGIESGVIVTDNEGDLQFREGDFTYEGDKLEGGWAKVHFKTRKFPMVKKVKLSTYQKTFGVWLTDPAGMICKVAEAQGLRDAFPTMLGGMYLREEQAAIDVDSEVLAQRQSNRPDFGRPIPSISMEDVASRKTEKTTPKPPAKPSQDKPQPEKAPETPPKPSDASQEQKPAEATTPEDSGEAGPAPEPPSEPSEPPSSDEQAEAEDGLEAETPTANATGEVDSFLKETQWDSDACRSVKMLASKSGVSGEVLRAWLVAKKLMKEGQKLHELANSKMEALNRNWKAKLPEIRAAK